MLMNLEQVQAMLQEHEKRLAALEAANTKPEKKSRRKRKKE